MKEQNILLCDPDHRWMQNSFNTLTSSGHNVLIASNGKYAQTELVQNEIDVLIIDLETQNHSAIEVIKYIKSKNLHTYIILTVNSEDILEQYFYDNKDIEKLGLAGILTKPFPASHLTKLIDTFEENTSWKDLELNKNPEDIEIEVRELDDSFTSLKVKDFFIGNMAIFDLHVKVDKNRYIRFLNAGDKISKKRLREIIEKYSPEHFYFKTKDRKQYINYINESIDKIKNNPKVSLEKKVGLIRNASEKYIDEMFTKGLDDNLIQEGFAICDSTYSTINNNSELAKLFKEYEEYDDSITSHLFLVSLFAGIIAKQIPWVTQRTFPLIMMGSFIHDIGKMKLPSNIRDMKPIEMGEEQFKIYETHPRLGAELLDGVSQINEQIIQVVYQHHEKAKCNGFPMGLTSVKIFPLAKIVGFADFIANRVVQRQQNPFDTMKAVVSEGTDIFDYDGQVVKAFLRSFIEHG